MELLTTILAYAHVLSAVSWLGGGILFSFIIGPRLGDLKPPVARDFLVTIVPPVVRFFQAAAGLTVLFGLLLLWVMLGGDYSQFSSTWGMSIIAGMGVAFVALVMSEAVTGPAFMRVARAAGEITPDSPPSPSFPALVRRAGLLGLITTLLLLLTLVFMVSAGFY